MYTHKKDLDLYIQCTKIYLHRKGNLIPKLEWKLKNSISQKMYSENYKKNGISLLRHYDLRK